MITKQQYVEYLISTPSNYTCTNLAEHLEGESHDSISDYLRGERHTARQIWELARVLIKDGPEAYLIVDDSVQAKPHSRQIELVKLQYSGNVGGLVRGIGVVNLVHSDGQDSYPIDYRVYAPQVDGKSKNDHFYEMVINAVGDKALQAQTFLFDAWYASVANLKLIHRRNRYFVTTLKSNRLVSLSKQSGYVHLEALDWTAQELQHGLWVKLKELPFLVRLFKLVAPNGDIDWLITNRPDSSLTAMAVQQANARRWQIEELHRALKQLTGSEKCQARSARAQRTHLHCCYHAWLSLKVAASRLGKSLYRVRTELFSGYLRAELRSPRIPAFALP